MKTSIKYIFVATAFAFSLGLRAQEPTIITPQDASNLFDGATATNWVSSFNGEKFPIDLEVDFGSTETVSAIYLQQPSGANLADCKVVDFEVYFKKSETEAYPETPTFVGTMSTSTSARQTFTLKDKVEGNFMLIQIKSVLGKTTINAALSEIGVRTQRKNGEVANTAYDVKDPSTWNGVTWTETEPYQIVNVNWSGKRLMSGDFHLNLFEKLGDNYNFTNTQINVMTSLKEIAVDETVKVLPTIAEDHVFITTPNEIKSISAVNLLGIQIPLSFEAGQVNVSTLTKGNYLLLIITDKGKSVAKIIKR